ncbi:MAG: NADH-quinone oxidoreductase subunit M [Planctomycetota bacterium]|nr:NADH-quinone oxidoreductase subunit M [Planctomycetota bacterium]
MEILTSIVFLPLITAAVLLFIPSSFKGLIRWASLIGAFITFMLATGLMRDYNALGGDSETSEEVKKTLVATKLAEAQEDILGRTHLGDPKPPLDEWMAENLPQPGEEFDHAAVRARIARIAPLARDPLRAWEECVELSYAMQVAPARHLAFVEYAPWIKNFNVNYFLAVDGLSLPLVWLTALLCVLCFAYSWTIEKGTKGFYILFLLLETGLIGVFCALDFFLFYVFWEIVLLPMYFLIGIWGGPNRLYAAIKFFIYTLAGSMLMLIVMLVMYFTAEPHTFNLLTLMKLAPEFARGSWGLQWFLFLGLFISFAIKIPVFPFHTWLPDAHVEAPTAVSVILAGVLLKMGGYGLFRISYPMLPDAATSHFFVALIAILGMINIIYGAFCALAQKDFKKLVAYSSISHMGFVLLGLAALTHYGVTGAVLQMFNHGVSSAMLFFLVGVIYDRAHHRDLTRFGGIGLQMPWYMGLATVGLFATLGLPGLNGFISEAMCFLGAWHTEASLITTDIGNSTHGGIASKWIVLVSLLGIVLTAAYILWTVQRVYLGTVRDERYKSFPDVSFREVFALAPLAFLCVLLGVYPKLLIDFMDGTLGTLTDMVRAYLPG